MPGGDRTGPQGFGPMTGRAAGFCAGFPAPGYINSVGGRGMGMGMGYRRGMGRGGGGRGRGWGARADYGFSGPAVQMPTAKQELDSLKQQADFLQDSLKEINKRIEEVQCAQENK